MKPDKDGLLIFWIEQSSSLHHKSEVVKKTQKLKFSKGFCHKENFLFCVFFGANQARKDSLLIFWIEKNAFLTRKIEVSKT